MRADSKHRNVGFLDMTINRRDAMKCGGKAVAIAAALPLLSGPPAKAGETDAVLIGLDHQHLGVMEELKRNLDQRRLVLDSIPEDMKREIGRRTNLYCSGGNPVTIASMHEAWRCMPEPLLERYEKALDERGMPLLEQQEDEIYARIKAIETKINETPASGFKGLAIK
ncbi:MAG: hypothetical protein O7D31_12790, partial [Alphaproteobacteria bacterium]|nr:hypothetical protein [Alphaproteobacteria bacterium]